MENFKTYLETQGLKEGTVLDYIGRVVRVARAEKITTNNLPSKITALVQEYSPKGQKSSIGKRSHHSVISALRYFLKFSNTTAEAKKG